MVSVYKVKNPDNNVQVELNEVIILDTIKILKHRKKELADIWVQKIESLRQKKLTDEEMDY